MNVGFRGIGSSPIFLPKYVTYNVNSNNKLLICSSWDFSDNKEIKLLTKLINCRFESYICPHIWQIGAMVDTRNLKFLLLISSYNKSHSRNTMVFFCLYILLA